MSTKKTISEAELLRDMERIFGETRIISEHAKTIKEMAAERKCSIPHMGRLAERAVKDGLLDVVTKFVNSRPAKAYLPKGKDRWD